MSDGFVGQVKQTFEKIKRELVDFYVAMHEGKAVDQTWPEFAFDKLHAFTRMHFTLAALAAVALAFYGLHKINEALNP